MNLLFTNLWTQIRAELIALLTRTLSEAEQALFAAGTPVVITGNAPTVVAGQPVHASVAITLTPHANPQGAADAAEAADTAAAADTVPPGLDAKAPVAAAIVVGLPPGKAPALVAAGAPVAAATGNSTTASPLPGMQGPVPAVVKPGTTTTTATNLHD